MTITLELMDMVSVAVLVVTFVACVAYIIAINMK